MITGGSGEHSFFEHLCMQRCVLVTHNTTHWADLSKLCIRFRQSKARGSVRRDSTNR